MPAISASSRSAAGRYFDSTRPECTGTAVTYGDVLRIVAERHARKPRDRLHHEPCRDEQRNGARGLDDDEGLLHAMSAARERRRCRSLAERRLQIAANENADRREAEHDGDDRAQGDGKRERARVEPIFHPAARVPG